MLQAFNNFPYLTAARNQFSTLNVQQQASHQCSKIAVGRGIAIITANATQHCLTQQKQHKQYHITPGMVADASHPFYTKPPFGHLLPTFSFFFSFLFQFFFSATESSICLCLHFSAVRRILPPRYIYLATQHAITLFKHTLTIAQQVGYQGETSKRSLVPDDLLLPSSNDPWNPYAMRPTLHQSPRHFLPVARQLPVLITDTLHRQLRFDDALQTFATMIHPVSYKDETHPRH